MKNNYKLLSACFFTVIFLSCSCFTEAARIGVGYHGGSAVYHGNGIQNQHFGNSINRINGNGYHGNVVNSGRYYHNNRHYNYYYNGGYYNYYSNGSYYLYYNNGVYYNHYRNGIYSN